jgi:Transcriptional regulatory protein, C terminal
MLAATAGQVSTAVAMTRATQQLAILTPPDKRLGQGCGVAATPIGRSGSTRCSQRSWSWPTQYCREPATRQCGTSRGTGDSAHRGAVTFAVWSSAFLGPPFVSTDGRELPLAAPQQRTLLAVLLLHAGEPVSAARLIDDLWGEKPPATAAKAVRVRISEQGPWRWRGHLRIVKQQCVAMVPPFS